jgi:hypothetical protein
MKEEQKDSDLNNQQNDQEIEIVDIDNEPISNKRIPTLPQPLLSLVPRQRRIQVVVTVSLIVLVLLALLGSNISVRSKLIQAVVPPPPTPTAPIPPGTDTFYISGDMGWGQLFLDGKLIPQPSDAYGNGSTPAPPIHLARGTHTLLWRADPFPPQKCTVSVPNNYHKDTCKYTNYENNAWSFNFPADITKLPPIYRNALTVAVQNALQSYSSTDTVPIGERYTTDLVSQQQAIAHEPLKVTLHYELDTDLSTSFVECSPFNFMGGQNCLIGTQDCRTFCLATQYFNIASLPAKTWNVFAAAHSVWDYSTLTGKPVVQHQVDRVNATLVDHLIPLQISWDGTQWHVKSSFSLIADNSVQSFTSSICDSSTWNIPQAENEAQVTANWSIFAASKATAECLGIATLNSSQVPHPPQTPALFLFRFGVLLAANDVAHQYWPTIQLAGPHAQQLAQQLYKTYKQQPQTG